MKLETSIRELHEMFMDMAMFVETQVMRHLPLVVESQPALAKKAVARYPGSKFRSCLWC